MMSIGFGEMAVLLVIILIIFGAGKLPKVMGDLGKGLRAFKAGINTAADRPESDAAGEESAAPVPPTVALPPHHVPASKPEPASTRF
jgi:sec-independent protein translocase protein TatA